MGNYYFKNKTHFLSCLTKEELRNLTPRRSSLPMESSTLSSTHSSPRFLVWRVTPVSRSKLPLPPPKSESRPPSTTSSLMLVPRESEKSNLSSRRDTVSTMMTTRLSSPSDHLTTTELSALPPTPRTLSSSSFPEPQSGLLLTTLWVVS